MDGPDIRYQNDIVHVIFGDTMDRYYITSGFDISFVNSILWNTMNNENDYSSKVIVMLKKFIGEAGVHNLCLLLCNVKMEKISIVEYKLKIGNHVNDSDSDSRNLLSTKGEQQKHTVKEQFKT